MPHLYPFLQLEEAAAILNCSIEQIRYSIDEGDLEAIVRTPASLPSRQVGFGEPEDIFSTIPVRMFWETPLGKWSRITPPVTWLNGHAVFDTLVVEDVNGEAPPRSASILSASSGDVDPSGKMSLTSGWRFPQNEVLVKRQEVETLKQQFQGEQAQASYATHPCLDCNHRFYSEDLAFAVRAWEHAATTSNSVSQFRTKIEHFLSKLGVGDNQRVRIKAICNPLKPGPKPNK